MNLSCGIIGLPNAGKSTLFNALLKKQQALVASYPFTTIEPNVGVVAVPDERLPVIAQIIEKEIASPRLAGLAMTRTVPIVPATVKFIDIAGLVKDAHKGEGLGNQFLAHIRETDLICHVLRAFIDDNIVSVSGEIDPVRDKEIVETELILADLETINKIQNSKIPSIGLRAGKSQSFDFPSIPLRTSAQYKNSKVKIKTGLIEKIELALNSGKFVKDIRLTREESELIKPLFLLTGKPVVYVVNVSEFQLTDDLFKQKLTGWQKQGIQPSRAVSAKLETELVNFSSQEQSQYLRQLGIAQTGLDRFIKLAYDLLGLITFYSGNQKQTTAWSIKKGTTAVEAADTVHTDFAKKFIKAEVIDYQNFVSLGGWTKARESGKVRLEGREYVVCDGDVIDFKVGA